MNKDLDHYLVRRYPAIFKNRFGDIRETCMAWGFECGDGWFNILNHACHLITHHIKHIEEQNRDTEKYLKQIADGEKVYDWVMKKYEAGELKVVPVPMFVASQVKEKFGTLRFYYSGGDDYIDGVVNMTESMSGATCEVCGAPGTVGGQGWISTRCETHREKKEEEARDIVVGDKIHALGEGEHVELVVVEVINQKEVKCNKVADEEWSEEKQDYVVLAVDETVYFAKYIEHPMNSYWNLEKTEV